MKVRSQQNDTVDALCWRHLGRTAGMVEQVLELNPGLADYGPLLPSGIEVTMPAAPAKKPNAPLLQLWD
ncbi:MAG: tail protein X [Duganella sp.]